jgi:hypothetical protein
MRKDLATGREIAEATKEEMKYAIVRFSHGKHFLNQ